MGCIELLPAEFTGELRRVAFGAPILKAQTMLRRLALLVGLAALGVPRLAVAGDEPAAESDVTPTPVAPDFPRLRVGLGANFMVGNVSPPIRGYPGGYPSSLQGIVTGGPGVEIDIGVRLVEQASVVVRLEGMGFCAGGSPFVCEASGYVIGEWLPLPWMSLASGAGYEMLAPPGVNVDGPPSDSGPHWYGVSAPIIVGFNLGNWRAGDDPHRVAIRPVLEWAGGVSPSTLAFAWHLGFGAGVAWL